MASLLTLPRSELRGALTPRVEHRPPIVGTEGDIGVSLMAAAGKPLEPWQVDGVNLMMSTRADGKWACYEYAEWVARQNGKGGLGEARVLAGLFVLEEELLIWSAHEYKTAMEAFRRIRWLIRSLGTPINDNLVDVDGVLVKISNTNGEEGFERLDNEQRLKFIARSKSSGRGFSGDVNVIDEAFAYTTDQAEALGPTLIARKNAQIIYLSSPPLTGETGDVMFELKKRAEAGGDDSLGYRDFGLPGDLDDLSSIDLDDHENWARANPALGLGRVTAETIQRLRKMLSANEGRGFAREVLGVWPRRTEGGGAIDMTAWVADLLDPKSKRHGDVAIAVDIAPTRDYAAIGLYGLRATDGLGHMEILDYRPGTSWLVDRIVEVRDQLNPLAVAMGRGTYASIGVALEKVGICPPKLDDDDKLTPAKFRDPLTPKRGDLAVLNSTDMSAACGQMLDAVRDKTFRHAGQTELDASAAGAKTRLLGDTLAWARKEAAADTSPLVAVTEARWAFESLSHLVSKDEPELPPNVW